MISDLARVSYKAYLYLVELFNGPSPSKPVPKELTEVISKITAAQEVSRKRLDDISTEAAALLKTLTEKEAEQIIRWKKDLGEFLMEQGIDKSCVDEFIKDPSPGKLNELRNSHPRKY